jgi:hypothetical protein
MPFTPKSRNMTLKKAYRLAILRMGQQQKGSVHYRKHRHTGSDSNSHHPFHILRSSSVTGCKSLSTPSSSPPPSPSTTTLIFPGCLRFWEVSLCLLLVGSNVESEPCDDKAIFCSDTVKDFVFRVDLLEGTFETDADVWGVRLPSEVASTTLMRTDLLIGSTRLL